MVALSSGCAIVSIVQMKKTILVTGGAGFIGSNFIHYILAQHPDWNVINLDKLTYAGSLANLTGGENSTRYRFVRGDICDKNATIPLVEESDLVINFAAETHVDRSIQDPGDFVLTDVFGTYVLLEAMRNASRPKRFIQISTDEVYGAIEIGSAKESDALAPRNPYAASKAGADRLAYSYFITYGLPIIITRASNNYGPRQYPEKVIPLFVTNAMEDQALPLYGNGLQIRDWLHVNDHCRAIDILLELGTDGETYNIGGSHELKNITLAGKILEFLNKPEDLIKNVADRPGHDLRYSLDTRKLQELGWKPEVDFESGLKKTIQWYQENKKWWQHIKKESTLYRDFQKRQYGTS